MRKAGPGNGSSRPGIEDELSTCNMRLTQILSCQLWESNTCAPNYVKALEKSILKTWIIVFCGKNKHIRKALEEASMEFKVEMREDVFDW